MTLDQITTKIRTRVGSRSPVVAILKFDFGRDGVVRIDGRSNPAVVDNTDSAADCTVAVTLDNFVRIAEGSLNPQMAFMTGKIRVDGDMSLALQLGKILG